MEDQKIIALIKENKNSKAFEQLYKYFPMVRKMVLSRGGKKEDAEDIYQEGLIILCRKIKDPNFILTSKLSTYLYSICQLVWKDELRRRQKQEFVSFDTALVKEDEDNILQTMYKESDAKLAENVIAELGERCRELLMLFYLGSLKLKTIAEHMGYSSENTAKNQKYKCLEAAKLKLKELKSRF